jgi:hypothetical protein
MFEVVAGLLAFFHESWPRPVMLMPALTTVEFFCSLTYAAPEVFSGSENVMLTDWEESLNWLCLPHSPVAFGAEFRL